MDLPVPWASWNFWKCHQLGPGSCCFWSLRGREEPCEHHGVQKSWAYENALGFLERGEQWVSSAGQSAQERKTRTRSNPHKSHVRFHVRCPHDPFPDRSTPTPCFHLRILPILHKLRWKFWLMLQDSGDNFEKSGQGCQYMWPDLTASGKNILVV